jgi:hypothetical protein
MAQGPNCVAQQLSRPKVSNPCPGSGGRALAFDCYVAVTTLTMGAMSNSGYYVTVRQRLDNEPAYLRKALEVPEVAIAYAAIL